nr:MAG: hypothetical protein ADFBMEEK_00055 [Peromyscus leucopus gammaherpesvirus]
MSSVSSSPTHNCEFKRLNSLICRYHNTGCIYQCVSCERYHVCDGQTDCVLVDTGDNIVCKLTGKCTLDNMPEGREVLTDQFMELSDDWLDGSRFCSLLESLKRDLYSYFKETDGSIEVSKHIIESRGLSQVVQDIIKETLKTCQSLFKEPDGYEYELLKSIYVHVIISIYSGHTIYNPSLFKCTKNKKYDSIAKHIRTIWMSIHKTGEY